MTKPEFDELGAAFSAFHHEVGGSARPATVAEVRSGAQAIRRRRTAAAMIAGVVAAVVLGGSIAYAGQWDQHSAPAPGSSLTATASASAATPSTSPSATPSDTPPASTPAATNLPAGQQLVCPASGHATTSGPITAADLCNATLQIPSWAPGADTCQHGTVKLTNGRRDGATDGSTLMVDILTFANVAVTGPAADDAAVVLSCEAGDPSTLQAVVFSRAAGGAIRTVGQVVGPDIDGQPIWISGVRGSSDGTVLLQVYQAYGSDGYAALSAPHQWRGYRLLGDSFTQTSGSTSFDADTKATSLTVATTPVVFGKGSTHASVKVTVTNTGTTVASNPSLVPILSDAISAVPNADCLSTPPLSVLCHTASIAPGASWTVTIDLSLDNPVDAKANSGNYVYKVQLRLGDQRYSDTTIKITVS